MSRQALTKQAKLEKRQQLESLGATVHPASFERTHSVSQARLAEGETVTIAGRLTAIREHGKLRFLNLTDATDTIQLIIRFDQLDSQEVQMIQLVDVGDFLGVSGPVSRSKTGELSILVASATFLGKALLPLPNEWNAAEHKEARFRKRYLDMLINPETRGVLNARWEMLKQIRRFLQDQHHFTEVETPIFQPLYGGTNAKPFTTHMNALDCDYYLRLAPELYLKRLIVGGYERIFEIARNFRNEGIDQTHQPEFTMIEWYEAYADYHRMMDVAEALIKHLASSINNSLDVQVEDLAVSLGGRWPRITMKQAVADYLDLDFEQTSDAELNTKLSENDLELLGEFTRGKALFAIFDKLVAHQLIQPTWIIDYPRDVSPLAKQHRLDPSLAERFELYVGGREIADGWSEITDPIDQRSVFEGEQTRMRAGDAEAHPLDEDFLEAMEYGMPPLGGIGIGIDRLVMFLTNTWSIREVIAFPTLRPIKPFIAPLAKNIASRETATTVATVDPAVSQRFPGMFYAYVTIEGITIGKQHPDLQAEKDRLQAEKSTLTKEEIAQLPAIAAYTQLFAQTGVDLHKRKPSPEALLLRMSSGKGMFTVNTAVDAYNVAVVESGVALGGFDASAVKPPVTLRFAQADEQVLLLGDTAPTSTAEGELVYADAEKILTLDLNYRDNTATKLTEHTTSIVLYADGAPKLPTESVVNALLLGAQKIVQYCGGTYSHPIVIGRTEKGPTTMSNATLTTAGPLPSREETNALMRQHIQNPALQHHVEMVARAMEAYANKLGEDAELWYATGLLHDLDWEEYPNEHPNKAIAEWLSVYPDELRQAVAAHAPGRTGQQPVSTQDKYLFACDELSGFLHAYSLMRPEGFAGMKASSVNKKLKDKSFAANVSRDDIYQGFELIGIEPAEHIAFLIGVFQT